MKGGDEMSKKRWYKLKSAVAEVLFFPISLLMIIEDNEIASSCVSALVSAVAAILTYRALNK